MRHRSSLPRESPRRRATDLASAGAMLGSMSPPEPSKPRPTDHGRSKRSALPPVDERLVMPESRFEIIDGKVEHVPPADQAHGSRHSKISALLELYAAATYDVALDMLTRTSTKGDMAPDASVYPAAEDPETGGRQLEELAFEVVSTERLAHAAKKVRALAGRGVRRIFAVDVERRRALEWSRQTDAWEILPTDGVIEDRALALPLPLSALVEAAKADDAVAQALLAKKNPVIEEALRAREKRGALQGRLEGKVASLLAILEGRGLRVSKKAEARIRAATDEATLDRWIQRALRVKSADKLFDD
ncbi:MAG: Uma2 family endonuclease [Minicystis sp.]